MARRKRYRGDTEGPGATVGRMWMGNVCHGTRASEPFGDDGAVVGAAEAVGADGDVGGAVVPGAGGGEGGEFGFRPR